MMVLTSNRKRMNIKQPLTKDNITKLWKQSHKKGYKAIVKNTSVGTGIKLIIKDGDKIMHFFNVEDIKEFLK